jgi:flagellar protein FlaJ
MEINAKNIIIVSGLGCVIILALAFLLATETALFANLMILAILVAVVPYTVYEFFEFKKITQYEREFPSFLRDLSESQRAGLSTIQAIETAARSDYGSLTKEIRKMNNQLSWNVPLEKVLMNFMKRVKKSNVINKAVTIIIQANRSGGDIEDIMAALANNIESIKEVQEEKSTLMRQQVIMMYAIFFIFLGITIILVKFLVPLIQSQTEIGESGFGIIESFQPNPCYYCIDNPDISCSGCAIFFGMSDAFGFGGRETVGSYYKSLFFSMILIQGFFSGLIAGQIGSDSIVAGLKHSFILLFSGVLIFIVSNRIGII